MTEICQDWGKLWLSTRICPPTVTLPAGPQGPAGNDGAPGEVTAQQLSDAVAGTSANNNTVQTLDTSADQAAIIAKLNELIGALRR